MFSPATGCQNDPPLPHHHHLASPPSKLMAKEASCTDQWTRTNELHIVAFIFVFQPHFMDRTEKNYVEHNFCAKKKKRLSKDDRNPSEVTNHTSLYECEFHYDVGSQQPELGLLSSRSQNDGRKLDETVWTAESIIISSISPVGNGRSTRVSQGHRVPFSIITNVPSQATNDFKKKKKVCLLHRENTCFSLFSEF